MKLTYWLAVAVFSLGAVVLVSQLRTKDPAEARAEWKRYAMENETKVRPERFESMKWRPDQGAELRAPASKQSK